jgi:diguanylate cyclase (GGDEF)-like protein
MTSALLCYQTFAYANVDVSVFLDKVKTVTYDCPDISYLPQLDAYLASDDIPAQQRFELLVNKTHFQNCNGQSENAQGILIGILNDPDVDKTSEYFASATYQLGFTFDMQERAERCEYYGEAFKLSEGKFTDIEMSSTLGLITNCPQSGFSDDSERIAAYFALVERYTGTDEASALAHIHNNIGLFFGGKEQHVLAAEQYLKAHELGQGVNTGSNRLSILISAISSLLASGQFERANEAILEFESINAEVATPLTNFWLYFAKAGYYYRVNDIEALEATLPVLKEAIDRVNSPFYQDLYRWYSAVPCLYHNDLGCLQVFVDYEKSLPKARKQYASYDYHKFLIRAYFALGDIQAASEAFEISVNKLDQIKQNNDGMSKVMGVANLYGQIYVLENRIQVAERRKVALTFGGLIFMLAIMFIGAYILRRRHLARMSVDPVTELLNSKTCVNEIAKVDVPSNGKTNALAIFDLGNFREVNRQVGSTRGDYVLQKIANTLTQVTRDNDILGRFAPEQFILCLTDIEESSAKSFFERVQQALEGTFIDGQHGIDISIRSSMSIYITNDKFDDLNRVLDDMLLSLSLKAQK